MRSSGSTRNRRTRRPIDRYVLVLGDDHPKACTGRRLLRQGLATSLSARHLGHGGLVLDPFATHPLSGNDRSVAERGGLAAIDCSWNRLSERGRFPGRMESDSGRPRRLPLLVATNPQHFGRIGELNTAEALGAALFLLGHREEAKELLAGFAGGEAFFEVNRDRLEHYRRARTPEEVLAAERALFGPGPAQGSRRRRRAAPA